MTGKEHSPIKYLIATYRQGTDYTKEAQEEYDALLAINEALRQEVWRLRGGKPTDIDIVMLNGKVLLPGIDYSLSEDGQLITLVQHTVLKMRNSDYTKGLQT